MTRGVIQNHSLLRRSEKLRLFALRLVKSLGALTLRTPPMVRGNKAWEDGSRYAPSHLDPFEVHSLRS